MSHISTRKTLRAAVAAAFATTAIGIAITSNNALAGGLLLYEIGTAEVGLASAGFGARAQDASTVFTNPAGMPRLDGNQATRQARSCGQTRNSRSAPALHRPSAATTGAT